jgi:hypothetical protein
VETPRTAGVIGGFWPGTRDQDDQHEEAPESHTNETVAKPTTALRGPFRIARVEDRERNSAATARK